MCRSCDIVNIKNIICRYTKYTSSSDDKVAGASKAFRRTAVEITKDYNQRYLITHFVDLFTNRTIVEVSIAGDLSICSQSLLLFLLWAASGNHWHLP